MVCESSRFVKAAEQQYSPLPLGSGSFPTVTAVSRMVRGTARVAAVAAQQEVWPRLLYGDGAAAGGEGQGQGIEDEGEGTEEDGNASQDQQAGHDVGPARPTRAAIKNKRSLGAPPDTGPETQASTDEGDAQEAPAPDGQLG